jgi:CheY-like chemotaxis protein
MKALIVDDSRTACRVLARLLARYQIDADAVPSAEEALERLRHHKPDVIFMDHAMPGMDGLETVRLLKSNPDTAVIPVVMYTSREGEVYVGQARALGAIDVLSKDSLEASLDDTVQRLRRVHARRQSEAAADPEPPATSGGGHWAREAQAELTRQMYLILTEQQISQRNEAASTRRGIDQLLAERLDALATRLEAAADLRTEALEQRLRTGERRLAAVSCAFATLLLVTVVLFGARITGQPVPAARADAAALERAVEGVERLSSALQARLAALPVTGAGGTAGAASAVIAESADGAALGWIVGRATQGGHYDAVSTRGYLFGITANGAIGWPLPTRYFAAPGCNGPALVRDLPGVVFREAGMRLWYTDADAAGSSVRPVSEMSAAGVCRQVDRGPMALRELLRNDPRVTGVDAADEPVRVKRG